MRIVYLANTRIPSRRANSKNVMKMCQALAHNGHKVVLMNYDYPDVEKNITDVYDFYGVDKCFPIKLLPRRGQSSRIDYRTRIKWFVRMQRPDLIIMRDHSLRYDPARMGIPIVLDAHKLIYSPRDIAPFRKLLASDHFTRMITNCNALRSAYLRNYHIPEERIQALHNGADLPKNVQPLRLKENGRLQVGYIGHLYPGKGMEIISALAPRCPHVDFHVVGGTTADAAFWQEKLKDAANVRFHGFQPHQEAVRWQLTMDVLLVPCQREVASAGGGGLNIGDWMSPIKIFEYMAAGKAILASDLPAVREILSHNKNAFLCAPDDIDAWMKALKFLSDHPAQRSSLGATAREHFQQNYTWQGRAKQLLAGLAN